MSLRLTLSRKGLILVAVPLFFELLFVGMLADLLRKAEYETWRATHAKTMIAEANVLLKMFYESGTAVFAYGTTRQEFFRDRYERGRKEIRQQIRLLRDLAQNSPSSEKSVKHIDLLANKGVELVETAMQKLERGESGLALLGSKHSPETVRRMIDDLAIQLKELIREQEEIEAAGPQAEAQSRQRVVQWLYAGVAINILLAVFLALYFNRGTTRRLKVLMDNTHRLARGERLSQLVSGQDEIAHLDKTFHDMASALAEAAAHKQELITMVSHDLRSPLTSVRASLTLLQEGAYGQLPPRANNAISLTESNVTRLIRLINDLLDIEKMEAGRLEMHFKEISVDEVAEQSIETVRQLAHARQIKIAVRVPEQETLLYADHDRLLQVMINLLSNAIKFSPEAGEITVTIKDMPESVEVQVTDQGRGVPPHLQSVIFERFQQVKGSDAEIMGGSGLGLAICKKLIGQHGGSIGVDSQEGSGSTFWFRIPKRTSTLPACSPLHAQCE